MAISIRHGNTTGIIFRLTRSADSKFLHLIFGDIGTPIAVAIYSMLGYARPMYFVALLHEEQGVLKLTPVVTDDRSVHWVIAFTLAALGRIGSVTIKPTISGAKLPLDALAILIKDVGEITPIEGGLATDNVAVIGKRASSISTFLSKAFSAYVLANAFQPPLPLTKTNTVTHLWRLLERGVHSMSEGELDGLFNELLSLHFNLRIKDDGELIVGDIPLKQLTKVIDLYSVLRTGDAYFGDVDRAVKKLLGAYVEQKYGVAEKGINIPYIMPPYVDERLYGRNFRFVETAEDLILTSVLYMLEVSDYVKKDGKFIISTSKIDTVTKHILKHLGCGVASKKMICDPSNFVRQYAKVANFRGLALMDMVAFKHELAREVMRNEGIISDDNGIMLTSEDAVKVFTEYVSNPTSQISPIPTDALVAGFINDKIVINDYVIERAGNKKVKRVVIKATIDGVPAVFDIGSSEVLTVVPKGTENIPEALEALGALGKKLFHKKRSRPGDLVIRKYGIPRVYRVSDAEAVLKTFSLVKNVVPIEYRPYRVSSGILNGKQEFFRMSIDEIRDVLSAMRGFLHGHASVKREGGVDIVYVSKYRLGELLSLVISPIMHYADTIGRAVFDKILQIISSLDIRTDIRGDLIDIATGEGNSPAYSFVTAFNEGDPIPSEADKLAEILVASAFITKYLGEYSRVRYLGGKYLVYSGPTPSMPYVAYVRAARKEDCEIRSDGVFCTFEGLVKASTETYNILRGDVLTLDDYIDALSASPWAEKKWLRKLLTGVAEQLRKGKSIVTVPDDLPIETAVKYIIDYEEGNVRKEVMKLNNILDDIVDIYQLLDSAPS